MEDKGAEGEVGTGAGAEPTLLKAGGERGPKLRGMEGGGTGLEAAGHVTM